MSQNIVSLNLTDAGLTALEEAFAVPENLRYAHVSTIDDAPDSSMRNLQK